ncbi:MAG TPA: Asp-tRNA(Asn)/Glu-tRNA(Gln) amidotransferase subunit GatC [Gemmatimonadaceae bacterium]|nr:Asp-tRNA(Asn)/Glu-tRNA(Gln) amidotransferase subunit GatC [Gemmatimonadaceae bacterium]
MSIRPEDVRHVAHLARLAVDESRLPALATQLASILAHMDVLQRVETTGVTPAAGVGSGATPLRADSGPPIPLERPLESFAPEVREGLLIVPRLATHGEEEGERSP